MTIYTLYVKTHNKTGLKYLGYTNSKNPHKYKGSGKYWTLHLKKHGDDFKTEILHECQNKTEIASLGIHYSNLWNIVESNKWANLKPETGDGGGSKMSSESLAKQAATFAARTPEEKLATKAKRSASAKAAYAKKTAEEKLARSAKISASNIGRVISAEARSKNSATIASKSAEEKADIANKIGTSLTGRKVPQQTLDKRAATNASKPQQQKDATSAKLSKSLTKAWANRK